MSTKLKKKMKKKKKKNQQEEEEEILPSKHERIGNVNYYSEEIAKMIFEKLFSLVFTSNYKNKIEHKMNEYCYELAKREINNLIELNNINHDCDDFDIDKIDINSCINYNNSDTNIKRYKIKRHNLAWETRKYKAEENLMETEKIPKTLKNKKNDNILNKSALIEKNKYLSKTKLYQYSIALTKNNFWDDIPCPKENGIDRTSSNYNNFIPKKEESKKDLKHIQRKSEIVNKEKYNLGYKNFVARLSKNLNVLKDKNKTNSFFDAIIPKKKQIIQLINYPSYPLENIEVRKELDNIDDLRAEAAEFSNKKEKLTKKKYV